MWLATDCILLAIVETYKLYVGSSHVHKIYSTKCGRWKGKMVGLQPWPPNTKIAFWFLAWSWFDLNSSFKNPGKHLNWDWFDWTFSRHWLWFDWTVHVLTLIWLNRSCIDSNLIKPFLYWHWFDWTVPILTLIWLKYSCFDSDLIEQFLYWLWFDWTVPVLTLIWFNHSCFDSNLIE